MSKSEVLRIPDYLGHILEAIEHIDRYRADTQTKKAPQLCGAFDSALSMPSQGSLY